MWLGMLSCRFLVSWRIYGDVAVLVQGFFVWDFGAWCKLSPSRLLAFGCCRFLALFPTQTGALVGPGDVGPIRDLDPAWKGAHSWRQGPMLGRVPPWAPASGTPWSSAARHTVPGLLRGGSEQRTPDPKGGSCCRKTWPPWHPQVHIPKRMEICLQDWIINKWRNGELLGPFGLWLFGKQGKFRVRWERRALRVLRAPLLQGWNLVKKTPDSFNTNCWVMWIQGATWPNPSLYGYKGIREQTATIKASGENVTWIKYLLTALNYRIIISKHIHKTKE